MRKVVVITKGTRIDSKSMTLSAVVFNMANPPIVTHSIPASALLMPVMRALTNKERATLLASKSLAF